MTEGISPGSAGLPERLIQLIPRFRPDADGLGEFALCIGDALWHKCRIRSDFVVWSPPRSEPELAIPGGGSFPHGVYLSAKRQKSAFAHALRQAAVLSERPVALLHFTPYAYSNEGIAWWLPGLLRSFVKDGLRLVCYFHESYAASIFLTKTWLTSGLQRRIFREVLELSSAAVSSNPFYMEQMMRDNHMGRPLALAGICSNVGEAKALPPASERKRRLVVFGLHPSRRRLYEQHLPSLLQLVAHLGIEEVAEVGPSGDWPLLREQVGEQLATLGATLKFHGPLPAPEVGEILSHSLAGAVNYPSGMEHKSGIVGAYQAYGLPVIRFCPAGETESADGDSICLSPQTVLAHQAGSAGLAAFLEEAGRIGFAFYRKNRSYDTVLEQLMPWLRVPQTFSPGVRV